MSHNTIQVPSDDYDRFVDAARAAAKPELGKLAQATIAALREMDAVGMFGDVAARHLWDEYCWQLQEGPYPTVHAHHEGLRQPYIADDFSPVRNAMTLLLGSSATPHK